MYIKDHITILHDLGIFYSMCRIYTVLLKSVGFLLCFSLLYSIFFFKLVKLLKRNGNAAPDVPSVNTTQIDR